jgi:putative transposase
MTDTLPAVRRAGARAPTFECLSPSAYRITLCTAGRARLFGTVGEGGVILSPAGRVVQVEWLRTSFLRPAVRLDAYVVMPDHFHGILLLDGSELAGSVGSIVAGFKAGSALRINQLRGTPGGIVWQRGCHERPVRPSELDGVREHIRNNPLRWGTPAPAAR